MDKGVEEKKTARKRKIVLCVIIFIIITLIVSMYKYLRKEYLADEMAIEVLNLKNVTEKKGYIKIDVGSEVGIIFYPGGQVQYEAYLPLLEELSKNNINIYMPEMPFNLAILNENAAEDIITENLDIKTWYIGGHSLGGIMASSYADKNQNDIKKLFLLGSYNYADYPLEKTLTIYGENDLLMKEDINYETNVIEIKGGNHAQFGNYGIQENDGIANITHGEQQEITVKSIVEFLNID